MAFTFKRNEKRIDEINRDFTKGNLLVDMSYQRRKIWLEQDQVRLIETILLGLVIPEVYFWPADIDPDSGTMVSHIVDGQQRINAISEFILGEFKLTEKYLMDESRKPDFHDKYFQDLDTDTKKTFWSYRISVVEIDQNCSKKDIAQMFYRLNLTNYSLNQQEKRNSLDSVFGDKAAALSELDFWKTSKVFSSTDAKRMRDVEYCCSIFILANEGIIDQTNDKKINNYYDDYAQSFDEGNEALEKIYSAIDIIKILTDKSTLSFISKKAQMYTLFCLAFKMIEGKIEFKSLIFEKFKLFVETYNKFRNEFSLSFEEPKLAEVYEIIKRYKLASSEGINKIGNRVIRFEVLNKVCLESDDSLKSVLLELSERFDELLKGKQTTYDQLEKDDLVDTTGES